MPSYELCLMLRQVEQAAAAALVKRTAAQVVQRGGIVRSVETSGLQRFPQRVRARLQYHQTGSFTFLKFDSPTSLVDELRKELEADQDVLRHNFVKMPSPTKDQVLRFDRCRQNKRVVTAFKKS